MTNAPLQGRTITVFGSSTLGRDEAGWQVAESLGRELARAGAAVMNGGYGGAMEAVSQGAKEEGGETVGVTVSVFSDRSPNPYLTRIQHTESLVERLQTLVATDGYIALEGSVGTLTEFFLAWNLILVEPATPRPLICLGPSWQELLNSLETGGWYRPATVGESVFVATDWQAAVARLISELA